VRPATVGELPDGTDVIQGCTVVHIDAADCIFTPDGNTKKAVVLHDEAAICEMCRQKWESLSEACE
jgi:hypothetical protein